MNMPCSSVSSKSYHYACMLYGKIRIEKLAAYCSHILSLPVHHHLLYPGAGKDLCIIIEHEHIIP